MVMTGQAVGSFCSPSGCGWGCMCSMVKMAGERKMGAIERQINETQKMQIEDKVLKLYPLSPLTPSFYGG